MEVKIDSLRRRNKDATPTYSKERYKRTDSKSAGEGGKGSSPAQRKGLFTLTPKEFEECEDLNLVEQTILTQLLKNSYFQGSNKVLFSLSLFMKYCKIKKEENMRRYIQHLEDRGYFCILRERGKPNAYLLNLSKIEADFQMNIEDYYPGYYKRIKEEKI